MRFLCEGCCAQLSSCPEKAKDFWNRTWNKGSAYRCSAQWERAVVAYGNSLDAAQIILRQSKVPVEDLERYLRTAQELIYAMRKGGYYGDIDSFLTDVSETIETITLPRPKGWYLRSVQAVADNPICAVDAWMKSLSESSFEAGSSVH